VFLAYIYHPIGKSNVSKNHIIHNSETRTQSKMTKEIQKYGIIFPNCYHSENKWEVLMQILYWWNW